MRELGRGYTSEVDAVDEETWNRILQDFDDGNIYQTWPYGEVTSGRRNMSHLILKADGKIVAVAQARIAKLPAVNIGIAYVRWGPLWRSHATGLNAEIFRQALRALRNEFVCKRGLVLRLFPILFDDDPLCFASILAEEGFSSSGRETRSRTILMDLSLSLEDLRENLGPNWKRNLKLAQRKMLDVVEGTDDQLFGTLIDIHHEMVTRKQFVEGNDINQFRLIQARLPEQLKMRIMLCQSDAGVCAGLVCSAIGRTAVYLFGATSQVGLKSHGSYLLHWKLIDHLKKQGCSVYDLNGINPARNPGTYKFKHDLGGSYGRDVCFLGRFDAHANLLSHAGVELGDTVRSMYQAFRTRSLSARGHDHGGSGTVNDPVAPMVTEKEARVL